MNKYRCLSLRWPCWRSWASPSTRRAGDDRKAGSSDKSSATKGMHTYNGKIVRVDADKHTLVLGHLTGRAARAPERARAREPAAGTGAASDRADTGAGEKGKAGDRTMTFQVSDKARISLDGKEAKLSDLKAGLYARVSTSHRRAAGSGSGPAPGGTSKASGDTGTRAGSDKTGSGGTAGGTHTATRVEAFTKAPTRHRHGHGYRRHRSQPLKRCGQDRGYARCAAEGSAACVLKRPGRMADGPPAENDTTRAGEVTPPALVDFLFPRSARRGRRRLRRRAASPARPPRGRGPVPAPPTGAGATTGAGAAGFAFFVALAGTRLDQFEEGRLAGVAEAALVPLEDAGVAARTVREARGDLVEQLGDDVALVGVLGLVDVPRPA